MHTALVLVHFLDPNKDPPQDVDTDARTVLALPHTSDRVITVSAATVATDPIEFLYWAEIPQPQRRNLRPAA